MHFRDVVAQGFLDELEKIAVTRKNMRVAQSRSGRRPMRVSTLLRKEKDGSLYKTTKLAAPKELSAAELVKADPFTRQRILSRRFWKGKQAAAKEGKGQFPERESTGPESATLTSRGDPSYGVVQARLKDIDDHMTNKFASAWTSLDPMVKEALLRQAIRRLSPNQRFIEKLKFMDPDLAQTAQQTLKKQAPAKRVEQWAKGMSQTGSERARAAGHKLTGPEAQQIDKLTKQMGTTSVPKRLVGGTIEGAAQHQGHAGTLSKAINPIGVPMGGAFEGLARQAGKETVRGAGELTRKGHLTAARLTGKAGTRLQKSAPVLGQAAEYATMAATHAPSLMGALGTNVVQAAGAGGKGFGTALAGKLTGAGMQAGAARAGRAALSALRPAVAV